MASSVSGYIYNDGSFDLWDVNNNETPDKGGFTEGMFNYYGNADVLNLMRMPCTVGSKLNFSVPNILRIVARDKILLELKPGQAYQRISKDRSDQDVLASCLPGEPATFEQLLMQ